MDTPALGLDFGTTNTVLARSGADGQVAATLFRHDNEEFSAFRSVLAFWQQLDAPGRPHLVDAGPWAIEHFLAEPEDTRFLQSFKSFAASPHFLDTTIAGRVWLYEDLLEAFFGCFIDRAGAALGPLPRRLILGRPVTFAGASPDAGLARERYEAAFRRFGFTELHHVYEPVAAAYWFAQRLERDATILVADFGGGTSDFSVIHFTRRPQGGVEAHPLAHTGVGIAGDTFDYRIIDHVVSPRLGKGTQYRSWGKILDIPGHYFTNFARWHQLSLMKTDKVLAELRQLARDGLEREKLEAFIEFIDADVGYPLYRAVSETKLTLSREPKARLRFEARGIGIDVAITRRQFEGWIADDLARIGASVEQAMSTAGITAKGIDRVFLTGGTSFVPAVRTMFEKRFGRGKIETGEQLLSIAYGLALIGREDDVSRWTVPLGAD